MREVDEVIKDQMDYILSKIYLEYLYNTLVIDKKEKNRVLGILKKKYVPPTQMLEGYNVKKNI